MVPELIRNLMVASSFSQCSEIMSLESMIMGTVGSSVSHTIYGGRSKIWLMVMAKITNKVTMED